MKSFKSFIAESTKDEFKAAFQFASKVHAGQKDLSGQPYMNHIRSVIKGVSHLGYNCMVVAALHDSIEDTNASVNDLRRIGISDQNIQSILAITKKPGESREGYYARVKRDPIARIVKLSDISNNMMPSRLAKLPPDRAEELKKKYAKARSLVENVYLEFDDVLPYTTNLLEKEANVKVQPWANSAPKQLNKQTAADLYNKILSYVLPIEREFARLLKRAGSHKEDKILYNVKKLDSFLDKVIARGKGLDSMSDILRGAILTSDKEGVERVVHNLRKMGKIVKYEVKEFGGDKKLGYFGSHHLDIQVGDVITEVQVMTKKLWAYKKAAHDIYVELRSGTVRSQADIDKMMKKSKDLFMKGNL